MEHLLFNMFKTQYELNNMINPNWKNELTKHDFKTAIITEYAEFIESYDWKWWKKGNTNMQNIKLELVDIIHFTLSGMLLKLELETVEIYLKNIDFSFYYNFNKKLKVNYSDRSDFVKKNDEIFTNFINVFDKYFSDSAWYFQSVITLLLDFIYVNGFGINDIYKIYVAKNTLNKFRLKNGYKEGRYNKIINNREDNDYVFEFIENYTKDIIELPNELYSYLSNIYQQMRVL